VTLSERLQQTWLNYRSIDDVPLSSAALTLLAWKQGHRGFRSLMQVPHYKETLQLPVDPLDGQPPAPIEILVVVAPKDFRTLPLVLESALRRSSNPVTSVVAVTTQEGLFRCRQIVGEVAGDVRTKVLAENEVLGEFARRRLRERFGSRYGWVLQQILTIECAAESRAAGVWVIDADTVTLRARTLLTESGLQILTPTIEYHSDYYDFLRDHGICVRRPRYSFVPHWMVMQPAIAKSAMAALGCRNGADLAVLVADRAGEGDAPVSVDYELYAQHAMNNWANLVKLARWSNATSALDLTSTLPNFDNLVSRYRNFASISFHSHL
jgi:hypothetical protein